MLVFILSTNDICQNSYHAHCKTVCVCERGRERERRQFLREDYSQVVWSVNSMMVGTENYFLYLGLVFTSASVRREVDITNQLWGTHVRMNDHG